MANKCLDLSQKISVQRPDKKIWVCYQETRINETARSNEGKSSAILNAILRSLSVIYGSVY